MTERSRLRSAASGIALDAMYGRAPAEHGPYRDRVVWNQEGASLVADVVAAARPALIGRFGTSELGCASYYSRWRQGRGPKLGYPASLRRVMRVNAGMFSDDDGGLDRWSTLYLDSVAQADVMGVWFNRNEHRIVDRFCPSAQLVYLEALNCVLWQQPWSAQLAGRRVLVVHPFARTIERQYREQRTRLFVNPSTLPEFELSTIVAVQSGSENPCPFPTWFDALESMVDRMSAVEFDVAIIGAGAYGMPLAAAAKRMGRIGINLGGATQLLFGVRGRRWEIESPDDIAPLFNEHWVRPSAEETPEHSGLVEGGCYW